MFDVCVCVVEMDKPFVLELEKDGPLGTLLDLIKLYGTRVEKNMKKC